MAILTLRGMTTQYPDIWDNFTLPDPLNIPQCVNTVLNVCADTELRYPDHDYLKFYIGLWCENHARQIERMYQTTILDYNPIHNYDMTEGGSDTNSGTDTDTESGSITRNGGGSDAQTRTITETQTTTGSIKTTTESQKVSGNLKKETTHNVSAYSSANLAAHSSDIEVTSEMPVMKDTVTQEPVGDGLQVTTRPGAGEDKVTRSHNETETFNNHRHDYVHGKVVTHEFHRSGNIGVTTTQKMLEDERALLQFNIFYWIAGMFEDDFCITVY